MLMLQQVGIHHYLLEMFFVFYVQLWNSNTSLIQYNYQQMHSLPTLSNITYKNRLTAIIQIKTDPMPKLKKYSQKNIPNQQSNTNISLHQFQLGESTITSNDNHEHSIDTRRSTSSSSQSSQISQSQHSNSNMQNSNTNSFKLISHSKDVDPKHKNKTEKKRNKNKFDADEILRKVQEECVKHEDDEPSKYDDDEQTGMEVPDNALVGFEEKKSRKKQGKNIIKVRNKFFAPVDYEQSNCEVNKNITDDEAEQLRLLEEEHKNILALRSQKNSALLEERKNQIQFKVEKIRNRLNFKNAYQDIRFKDHFKQTLDNVKDCEQVQIMIEPPKIFKGATAKHADAALYIKNLSQNQHSSQPQNHAENSVSRSIQKQNINNKNKKVDRRQFYQDFTRQLKETKAVQIPIQKEGLFKKSSLDQLQNQFKTHEHLFKQDGNSRLSQLSRHSLTNERQSRKSLDKIRTSAESDKQKLNRESSRSKIEIANSEHLNKIKIKTVQEEASNQDSKAQNQAIKIFKLSQTNQRYNSQIEKQQCLQKNQKPKIFQQQISKQTIKSGKTNKSQKKKAKNEQSGGEEKQKKHKKSKDKPAKAEGKINRSKKNREQKANKKIKQLFDEEAEDSQNGYGDDGHSSDEGDDSSVQSIIDRKEVKYVLKNEREARKKFMADQYERDEEIIRRIKEKITETTKIKCQQSSESRRRRKQRIVEAKKKFEEEDQNYEKDENKQIKKQPQKQESGSDRNEFSKKLQDLEQEILKKKDGKHETSLKPNPSAIYKKKPIWQEINIGTIKSGSEINQEKRGGFLNNEGVFQGGKIKAPKKSVSKKKTIQF